MGCSLKGYNIAVIRALLDELSSLPLSSKDIRTLSSCSHQLYSIVAFWRKERDRVKLELARARAVSPFAEDEGLDDLPF